MTTRYGRLGQQFPKSRFFSPRDSWEVKNRIIVISYNLWQKLLNADAGVLGKAVSINGLSFTVIGIMPPDYCFYVDRERADAWIPLIPDDRLIKSSQIEGSGVIARLKSAVSLTQAQARTDVIFHGIKRQRPELKLTEANKIRLIPLRDKWFGSLRFPLLMLLGAAVCLLLIACANTASLILARAATRQKEMAIRAALGASWVRIMRQQLIESLLLGLLGGTLGFILAYLSRQAINTISPVHLPQVDEAGISIRIVCFALIVSLLASVLSGFLPAWRISKLDLYTALKESGSRSASFFSPRLRKSLVISQIMLTMMLLTSAGLLIKSFRGVLNENFGFDTHNVLTLEIMPVEMKYPDKRARIFFYQQIINQIRNLPGVTHVGMVNYLPLFSGSRIIPIELQERAVPPELWFSWSYRIASSDYFRAMGIQLVSGRSFTEQDEMAEALQVVIIDKSAADFLGKYFFPNENIIGKHLILNLDKPTTFEIIGVVGDIRQQGLEIQSYPGFYLLASERVPSVANLVIRTASKPSATIISDVSDTIRKIDGNVPVSGIQIMETRVAGLMSHRRFAAFLSSILSVVALLLSIVGLYGLMSHLVTHRAHEIGIRLALGARQRDVLRLIVSEGMSMVILGVFLGLAAAIALSKLLRAFLYGVSPTDPAIIIGTILLLLMVALFACLLPAFRAIKIDPLVSLRCE